MKTIWECGEGISISITDIETQEKFKEIELLKEDIGKINPEGLLPNLICDEGKYLIDTSNKDVLKYIKAKLPLPMLAMGSSVLLKVGEDEKYYIIPTPIEEDESLSPIDIALKKFRHAVNDVSVFDVVYDKNGVLTIYHKMTIYSILSLLSKHHTTTTLFNITASSRPNFKLVNTAKKMILDIYATEDEVVAYTEDLEGTPQDFSEFEKLYTDISVIPVDNLKKFVDILELSLEGGNY